MMTKTPQHRLFATIGFANIGFALMCFSVKLKWIISCNVPFSDIFFTKATKQIYELLYTVVSLQNSPQGPWPPGSPALPVSSAANKSLWE